MSSDSARHDRNVAAELHPSVPAVLFGLVVWLGLSVWLFAGGGDADYLLAVVCVFFAITVALVAALWRNARRYADSTPSPRRRYRDWAKGEFDTWPGRLKAANAAIEIALPIAAVALGMTAFGIVLRIVTLTLTSSS